MQSLLPRLRQLFGQDIEIVSDLSPDMAPVIADPVQVRHIILTTGRQFARCHGAARYLLFADRNPPAEESGHGGIGERPAALRDAGDER